MTDNTGFGLAPGLDRALDDLVEIHTKMRWLELDHALDPSRRDLVAYKMLADDLAVAIGDLLREVTRPEPPPDGPMDLAATAFPIPIAEALAVGDTTPGRPLRPVPPPAAQNRRRP
jgi:hypothetical protein